ncbi:hypothetical protein Q0601_23880 [Paracoccus onubensis]|uniref:hypothetical protein n=1 Tax=Paracoccus onubensis TaxID=1675788 RepID=UPI002730BB46|nr:hypothetical protein [Paracoccus onubensis]MDP0930223.1 hypothetical protein [Paracoccus onubensis]
MARQKQTVAERLRVVVEPARNSATPLPSPDPRLAELVQLLARQAARDFVEAEDHDARDHPPD